MSKCQFCDSETQVRIWIPAGAICSTCKKNLEQIRKYKLGIPCVKR
ncbi:MAG: hypothetical protein ACOCP8_05020 [archaeon]